MRGLGPAVSSRYRIPILKPVDSSAGRTFPWFQILLQLQPASHLETSPVARIPRLQERGDILSTLSLASSRYARGVGGCSTFSILMNISTQ